MLMDEIEEMLHDLPTLRVLLLFSNKGGAADYDAFQQSGSLSKVLSVSFCLSPFFAFSLPLSFLLVFLSYSISLLFLFLCVVPAHSNSRSAPVSRRVRDH